MSACEFVALAIMAAEKRGEERAQSKMEALLKDPAAVRLNYLRGGIACQELIREGEEREREACAAMAEKALIGSLCPYGSDKPGDPTWNHTDEDICPVCRVNSQDALFKCHDSVSGRLAANMRKRGEG